MQELGLHDIEKKKTMQYFFFLQYILQLKYTGKDDLGGILG